MTPPSLAVRVGSEEVRFDPPDVEIFEARTREGALPEAPKNYADSHQKKVTWPDTLRLTPLYDGTHTHILGAFFRSFQPETLTVASEDGTPYRRDEDFLFQKDWGVIANKDGRMTGRIKASAKAALQRLDLVQLDANGKPSIKKGKSAWVCPELPEADPGHKALAGVYIAPWRAARSPYYDGHPGDIKGASEYAVTKSEIFPVDPASSVPPLHPERLEPFREKLREGKPVKIAFLGDSITLGAESTRWWNDKYDESSLTWKGRVVHALREKYPSSKIEVIEAYKGGVTIEYGLEKIAEVLAQKPDLVVLAFGVNDADSDVGGPPKSSIEMFRKTLASLADQAHAAGSDVLFVTPFPLTPWLANGQASRLEAEYVPAIKDVAASHGATVADVNAEYKNLNTRGIPWVSQNHNWINHPGNLGHQVYADTVLRCFP